MTRRTAKTASKKQPKAPLTATEIRATFEGYRAQTVTRLDALLYGDRAPADEAALLALLDGFAEGTRVDDAHLAHSALSPLEHARGALASATIRALTALVPDLSRGRAHGAEGALERITDLAAAAPVDVIAPLLVHARACFARDVRAVWDDRWAFESLWAIAMSARDAGDEDHVAPILAFSGDVIRGLVAHDGLAGDGSLFSCAVDALDLIRHHAKRARPHALRQQPAVEAALACTCSDVVRAAAATLHALIGSRAYAAHLAQLIPALAAEGRFVMGPDAIDVVTPDAYVHPLLAARADWFDVLFALLEHAPAVVLFCDPGRLMRSRHANAARVEQLAVYARSRRQACRDAARALVAEVPKATPDPLAERVVRIARLPAPVPRNPYEREPAALATDLVWVAQQRVLDAAPAGEWLNDEERLGVRGVHPSDPALDRELLVPFVWPMTPTGAADDKRILKLVAVDATTIVVTVREGFADDSGWGSRNFVLRVEIATGAWSLLTDPAPTYEGVPLHADTALRAEDAWCGGELVAWTEAGTVQTHADTTPYFLDDYAVAPATTRARATARERRAHLDDLALEREPWLRGVDVIGVLRAELARVDLDEPVLEVISAGRTPDNALLVVVVSATDPDTQDHLADVVVTIRPPAARGRGSIPRDAQAVPETTEASARPPRAPQERRKARAHGSRRAARVRARNARDDLGQAR